MNPLILTMGLNHTTAPVQVREQVASAPCIREDALNHLQTDGHTASISESLVLSTCNRTELYLVTTDMTAAQNAVRELFSAHDAFSQEADHLYTYVDRSAVEHLFGVASGIDSMILGEVEILGQVRNAYVRASEHGTVGPVLHHLFNRAIHTGKRSHAETGIGAGALSVAYAAVTLARRRLGPLAGKRVLIAGAGEAARRAAKSLVEDATDMTIASRTFDHAVELARETGGRAVPLTALHDELPHADLVISATSAPHLIIRADTVRAIMQERADRPLLLIDIAVPRDIDPETGQIDSVALFNIDDLQRMVDLNLSAREHAVSEVRRIIAHETDAFCEWLAERRAAPVIADLRDRAEAIRALELDKALRRLGHLHLSERDRNVIAALSSGILNRFLAAPTEHLKEAAQSGDGDVYLCAMRELFDLASVDEQEQVSASL